MKLLINVLSYFRSEPLFMCFACYSFSTQINHDTILIFFLIDKPAEDLKFAIFSNIKAVQNSIILEYKISIKAICIHNLVLCLITKMYSSTAKRSSEICICYEHSTLCLSCQWPVSLLLIAGY